MDCEKNYGLIYKFKVSSWHCLLAELKNTIDFFQSIAYYLIGTWSTC